MLHYTSYTSLKKQECLIFDKTTACTFESQDWGSVVWCYYLINKKRPLCWQFIFTLMDSILFVMYTQAKRAFMFEYWQCVVGAIASFNHTNKQDPNQITKFTHNNKCVLGSTINLICNAQSATKLNLTWDMCNPVCQMLAHRKECLCYGA